MNKSFDKCLDNLGTIEQGDNALDDLRGGWWFSLCEAWGEYAMTDGVDFWTDFETKYRDKYRPEGDKSAMPTVYRTSKSVIHNATQLGIPLLDEEGLLKGKTAVEKEIKARREVHKAKDAASTEVVVGDGKTQTLSETDLWIQILDTVDVLRNRVSAASWEVYDQELRKQLDARL